MDFLNKKRVSNYWSDLKGVGDPVTKETMKEKCFRHIISCLSFTCPSAPSRWGKFHYVDSCACVNCRVTVVITQYLKTDESMIKYFSCSYN